MKRNTFRTDVTTEILHEFVEIVEGVHKLVVESTWAKLPGNWYFPRLLIGSCRNSLQYYHDPMPARDTDEPDFMAPKCV